MSFMSRLRNLEVPFLPRLKALFETEVEDRITADVTIIIGTFGIEADWEEMVFRAIASVAMQTIEPRRVVWCHADSLHEARNLPAMEADTEWLIFLDADDELDEGYVEAMMASTGDIRQPATLGVVNGVEDDEPYLIPERDLMTGNYIVIGAMQRTENFKAVDGFSDYPMFEDWHLYCRLTIRMHASVVPTPAAIYRVHVRADSRNHQDPELVGKYYSQIRDDLMAYR